MSRVLLDGWPLVYEPASPAALQTWALLAWHPPEIELILALPSERPGWIPGSIESSHHLIENNSLGRLSWEQRELPRLGNRVNASIIHTTSQAAPLFSRLACTHSPAYFSSPRVRGLVEHVRSATGQGGLSNVRAQLWPADLPEQAPGTVACAPFVHPEFSILAGGDLNISIELPETFILYHGPHDETTLRRLLSAWDWASGPIGEYYPLLLLGPDAAAQNLAWRLIKESQAEKSMQILPKLPSPSIPALYQRCTVLFHPAEIAPWGDPTLQALACGKPIVAAATAWANSRLGPAAYTAPIEDPRALGAALITVVVEDSMAENLSQAAHSRASTWDSDMVHAALRELWTA